MLIAGLPVLALGFCVAACSGSSGESGSSSGNPAPIGGQVCSSGGGNTSSQSGNVSSGDVQLSVCTTWTCAQAGSSVKCTASQPTKAPIPPGNYTCASDEGGLYCPTGGGGGGGFICVATESELTCTPAGDCTPGTEGCPSSGEGGAHGGDCTPGTEGCPSSGEGGTHDGDCTPGTEGCPSSGEGGASGTGSGGSGGAGDCTPGTEGCPSGGSGGSGGSGSGSGGSGGGAGGAGGACTFTLGYWKTHPDAWPVGSLTIGGVAYSEDDLLAIFAMDPSGDASLILAHQLIAALLNQAAAANPTAAVTQALGDAQAWMVANADADGRLPYGTDPGSAAANQAAALSATLDSFNNGLAGVPHCQ